MRELTLVVNPKEYGLEEVKASEMVSGLSTTIAERDVLKDAYLDVLELDINEENLCIFKELRLKIVKNRTQGIEKWHKTNKAFYLAGGRFVDAIKNKEILINQEMESKLLDAEKFFENQEKERIDKLQSERIKLVEPYLESVENLDLSYMEDDVFEAYLSTKKKAFEDKKAEEQRIENDRLEAERLEKERIEKQRIENELLKKEAELREKEIEKERLESKKIEDLRIAKENKERKDREEKQRIEDAKKEAILKKEREEKAKLEAELKSKKDAEIKAEKERLEAEKLAKLEAEKLAKAPIKKQLNIWVESFNIDLPNSELLNNEKALLIKEKFNSFKKWAKSEVNNI